MVRFSRRNILRTAAAAPIALAMPQIASAQSRWPAGQPIQVIAPFAAGGGVDLLARLMGTYLEKYLPGSRFITVNRVGASGQIGFTAVARAAPDGFTTGVVTFPSLVAALVERQAQYTLEDFTFLANIVTDPSALVVKSDSPYKTLQDFIADAKRRPGQLTVGSSGVGGPNHQLMLLIADKAGIQLEHVPFGGTAQSRTALLGGHLSAACMGIGEGWPQIQQGQLRSLGTGAEEPSPSFPGERTLKQNGLEGVVMGSSRTFAGPKGLPAEIVARFSEAITKVVADPQFRADAEKQGQPLDVMNAERTTQFARNALAQAQALFQRTPWR
ncbi:MAG: tripartite tricarboxylate transporter substrate binding protein [Alphaproteobacteria bacterium]|nr:tripartite tricarboxylate transporter substrate binding protein [Alphaproteobacteria bacterium]